ncbi:MAG: SDR family oxidoreductase [Candidatus Omnitrophica bacterium]|nr:SDR family oxidoreductase [Candidatus Omnitrophota bacterium]
MHKKTVVITGGAGFIGAHLCYRLISEGYSVICVDNFMTGSLDNIRPLIKDKDFKLIVSNVSGYIKIRGKVDYVLHCASLASPADYLDFPIQTLKAGSLGTHNALGLAKDKKSTFMLFSTSEVYGDPLVHPQKEDYWGNVNCVGVRGCYDESKRFAEAITMAYHRAHRINTKIARIFNTYGPMMRPNDGRVVSNFINQALFSKPITIYGKGMQTRSFCYIEDLVEGLYRLMRSSCHQPVNLGNPNEFTIMELAKLILKLTGSKSKIIFKSLPEDDPRKRQPSIALAKKALGWEPKVRLKDGLNKTIDWFQKMSKNT